MTDQERDALPATAGAPSRLPCAPAVAGSASRSWSVTAPRLKQRSAADYADAPQPAPVIWRDVPDAPDSTDVDAVLSVGECALLSGAGGLGKSALVLELATAAVVGAELAAPSVPACGLRVASGPVALVSYEDAPARIAHRLRWANHGTVPAAVHLAPDPAPLWVASVAGRAGDPGDPLLRALETACRLPVGTLRDAAEHPPRSALRWRNKPWKPQRIISQTLGAPTIRPGACHGARFGPGWPAVFGGGLSRDSSRWRPPGGELKRCPKRNPKPTSNPAPLARQFRYYFAKSG